MIGYFGTVHPRGTGKSRILQRGPCGAKSMFRTRGLKAPISNRVGDGTSKTGCGKTRFWCLALHGGKFVLPSIGRGALGADSSFQVGERDVRARYQSTRAIPHCSQDACGVELSKEHAARKKYYQRKKQEPPHVRIPLNLMMSKRHAK